MIARFGPFTVDSGRRVLLDGDRIVTVPPKAFDLLELLIRQAPNVVTKETIAATVWPNEAPSDASLAMAVTELRKALGETGEHPQFVRTVHRRGYAFSAVVERIDAAAAPEDVSRLPRSGPAAAPRFWLVLGDKTLPLASGDTLAGRDPGSALWL